MPEAKPQISITDLCARVLNVKLSDAQAALLAAIYELPMNDAQREMYELATTQTYIPHFCRDILALAGRRSGKTSRIIAPFAVYETCVVKHRIPFLERGTFLICAPSEKQAQQTGEGIAAAIENSIFKKMVLSAKNSKQEFKIKLSNRIDIVTGAADRMHLRGPLYIGVALEEASFFRDSNSGRYNLDEIMAAIRPGLLTDPLARMLRASSVWTKSGVNYLDWQNRAELPSTLAWKLESWLMNPSLPAEELSAERDRDETYFLREYGCVFADAANQLIDSDALDACVAKGVREFPPGEYRGVCALDPSQRGDDFAMAVANAEGKKIRLDYCKRWRPEGGKLKRYLDYNVILPEVIAHMRRYGCSTAYSDQVSAAAISAELSKAGLAFEHITTYGSKAAPMFQLVRQKFVAREVILPDDPELIAQLKRLEEIRGEGGKSSVGAATGRDDLAVATVAAIYQATLAADAPVPYAEFFAFPDTGATALSRGHGSALSSGLGGDNVEIEWDEEQQRHHFWHTQ